MSSLNDAEAPDTEFAIAERSPSWWLLCQLAGWRIARSQRAPAAIATDRDRVRNIDSDLVICHKVATIAIAINAANIATKASTPA